MLADCGRKLEAMPRKTGAYHDLWMVRMPVDDKMSVWRHRINANRARNDLSRHTGEHLPSQCHDIVVLTGMHNAVECVGFGRQPAIMPRDLDPGLPKDGKTIDFTERTVGDIDRHPIWSKWRLVLDL